MQHSRHTDATFKRKMSCLRCTELPVGGSQGGSQTHPSGIKKGMKKGLKRKTVFAKVFFSIDLPYIDVFSQKKNFEIFLISTRPYEN